MKRRAFRVLMPPTCVTGALISALMAGVAVPGMAMSTEAPVGMVDAPCPPALVMPAAAHAVLVDTFIRPHTLHQADFDALMRNEPFAAYNAEQRRRGAGDWAGLCRYRAANEAQGNQPARVVFIGDSITENWLLADPAFFSGGIVNRGIGAQTSAQMLVRFRADVVALQPAAVHILAGTNDVAGNNGPVSPADFRNNIESMVELARASDIHVILGSIPPAATLHWQPSLRPAPRIAELNAWLRDYAARHGLGYVDYHAALAGAGGELPAALGNDGVHPNRDGYVLMRRLAETAMTAALHEAATNAAPASRSLP